MRKSKTDKPLAPAQSQLDWLGDMALADASAAEQDIAAAAEPAQALAVAQPNPVRLVAPGNEAPQPRPDSMGETGYRPLRLTLTGFKGIHSGLGRDTLTLDLAELVGTAQLVAFSGANGRGKTTIMDNLHPYLVMPSRAGADGLGSFSYYDHVRLPLNEKVLEWSHGGREFKTHLVFRVNKKKTTEAFLFERRGGDWVPVVLPDGTVCDGKVELYEHALRELLGPPETFFTSVFSAQGKRALSAYKNGEIKALLADLLGLEHVRRQGAKAAEVRRDLETGLVLIRRAQEQAEEQLRDAERDLGACPAPAALVERVEAARRAKTLAAVSLQDARELLGKLQAEQEAGKAHAARRQQLDADGQRAQREHDDAVRRLDAEGQALQERERALARRIDGRKRGHRERRDQVLRQVTASRRLAELAHAVKRAQRRLPRAERVLALREEHCTQAQARADRAEKIRVRRDTALAAIASVEREAGEVALRVTDLQRRFGLAAAVPCAGSDLAGRCQLLGDARAAQALLPDATGKLRELNEQKRAQQDVVRTAKQALEALGDVLEQRNLAEQRLELAQERVQRVQLLLSRADDVAQACEALAGHEADLAALPEAPVDTTEDEAAERQAIGQAREQAVQQRQRVATALREQSERLATQRSALPAPFDAARVESQRRAVADLERTLARAEADESTCVRATEQAGARKEALQKQRDSAAKAKGEAEARAAHVASELELWTLLAKSLSNDGVIALDIDDAGPTFSALANELLRACYGPRFTLEVITQLANAKGGLREDFDILVHDGWSAESKSLKLVSGGERVWINECLTRAIALYLAENTGRRLGTLFSDEADGPLDPERKRMFMAMKRKVLELGGYGCEFFVSQTPELTQAADVVIDLEQYRQSDAVVA